MSDMVKLYFVRRGLVEVSEHESVRMAALVAVGNHDNARLYAIKIERADGKVVWVRSGPPWGMEDLDRLEELAHAKH